MIGVIFTLTKLFDSLYSISLNNSILLNGGDISYCALMFNTLFLIISQPDPKVVRNIIYFVFILNLFLAVLFLLINTIQQSPNVIYLADISSVLLHFTFQSLFWSFFLISTQILFLLFLFRKLLDRIHSHFFKCLFVSFCYAFVLILDGIFYPWGINILHPGSNLSIINGIVSKIIFGVGFGLFLFVYLLLFPSKLSYFMAKKASFLHYILPPKRRELIEKYNDAKNEIQVLRTLLPICLKCKKVRDDAGYWTELDKYLHTHSDFDFSHGYCEKCFREEYPDIADEIIAERKNEITKESNEKKK